MIRLDDETEALTAQEIACIENVANTALTTHNKRGSVDILAVQPSRIQALNREYRSIDSVTDVLSFPSVEAGQTPSDGFWGDIVLCPSRAAEQAEEYGHSLMRELAFLTVHGMLHLFGFDHIEPEDETVMIEEQKLILERMGLPR